uniref:Uncharacterized protein n=1 Tax=Mandrillus leucophaeus TaxID=9568 RepID=A0A2K5XCT4_MANLE
MPKHIYFTFKSVTHGCLEFPRSFTGFCEIKTIFMMLFAFFTVLTFTLKAQHQRWVKL